MDYKKRLYDLRTDNDLKQTDIAAVLKITGRPTVCMRTASGGCPLST